MHVARLRRKKRRNVQEQNAVLKDAIVQCASRFRKSIEHYGWLVGIFNEKGLDSQSGMLVELRCIPDQEGDLWIGRWLTADARFLHFEVMRSRQSGRVIDVETWEDITASLPVTERSPGTGKSFAYLALEALREQGIEAKPE